MRNILFPVSIGLLILPGCQRETNFNKKYEAVDAELKTEIERLDKQIDAELKREPSAISEVREPK